LLLHSFLEKISKAAISNGLLAQQTVSLSPHSVIEINSFVSVCVSQLKKIVQLIRSLKDSLKRGKLFFI